MWILRSELLRAHGSLSLPQRGAPLQHPARQISLLQLEQRPILILCADEFFFPMSCPSLELLRTPDLDLAMELPPRLALDISAA